MGGLAILAAFGLCWGVGRAEIRSFEHEAAAEIASKLQGPDKRVVVRSRLNGLAGLWGDLAEADIAASNFSTKGLPLFTEPNRSKQGIIRRLHIRLTDFQLSGLDVASLEASIPDCRYDFGLALRKKQIRLSRSGVGMGRVIIRQEALEKWILRKFHEIKRVTVRIDKDKAWVEGYGEFLITKTNFEVIASLEPLDGTKLVLTDAKVYFEWNRVDEPGRKVLLDTLNPVVDLRKDLGLFDAIEVEGLRLRDGVVEAWGKTRIPILPASQ